MNQMIKRTKTTNKNNNSQSTVEFNFIVRLSSIAMTSSVVFIDDFIVLLLYLLRAL